jgi:hypothetical protein
MSTQGIRTWALYNQIGCHAYRDLTGKLELAICSDGVKEILDDIPNEIQLALSLEPFPGSRRARYFPCWTYEADEPADLIAIILYDKKGREMTTFSDVYPWLNDRLMELADKDDEDDDDDFEFYYRIEKLEEEE